MWIIYVMGFCIFCTVFSFNLNSFACLPQLRVLGSSYNGQTLLEKVWSGQVKATCLLALSVSDVSESFVHQVRVFTEIFNSQYLFSWGPLLSKHCTTSQCLKQLYLVLVTKPKSLADQGHPSYYTPYLRRLSYPTKGELRTGPLGQSFVGVNKITRLQQLIVTNFWVSGYIHAVTYWLSCSIIFFASTALTPLSSGH